MHTERILSAGMAIVVIAAIGLSASTLGASMSTDPADAVDVQWDRLPLGDDGQGEVEAAAQNVDETYQESTSGSGDSQNSGSGSSAQQAGEEPGNGVPEQAGSGESRAESADRQGAEQSGSDAPSESGPVPTGWPWWVALLVAVVAAAYRYRDRLRRALGRGDGGPAAEPLEPAPGNEVERAWVELIERAGIDRPRTRTPRDCARHAVERGFDPGAVERLRRTFEDVQYGTTPPSDEQVRLARETLARLEGERA
ncbi:hypothetical protein BRC96_11295 [Halobacteriales archaeon QS_6_64_34]|nr:MAG: hypothetical protein BRC96_11295 [Halobacteriales archaeon QS_6_64_34]